MIKAILFDLDGVLVDAVDWHFQALNRALGLFGHSIDREEHNREYNGLPTLVKLKKLSERNGLPLSLHSFINEMKQQYTQETLQRSCHPKAAVSQLLTALSEKGYTIGVCSNSSRRTLETVLERMGIRDYFDVVLSANEVRIPKPNPEIYESAFELLALSPEECLIIEDSPPGVESAIASDAHVLKVAGPDDVTLSLIESRIRSIDGVNRKRGIQEPQGPEIEIIIPMAGLGTRFSQAGYSDPKPLIPVLGKPMIQWVVENIRPRDYQCHFTFLCNAEHLKSLNVERFLRKLEPRCTIIPVRQITGGAACTVLLANDRLLSSKPVLVANSDQWVNLDIDAYLKDAFERETDGSIMTFQANDPKWSFAKVDAKSSLVTSVAEKKPISPHATVGIYFFRRASDLGEGIRSMIRKNIKTNGEYYLCPVYNELIEAGKKIHIFEIPPDSMHGLGTPEDLATFLEKNS